MKTIWKFPLKLVDTQVVVLPIGSRVLSVGLEPRYEKMPGPYGAICIWVEVDSEQETRQDCWIELRGTGHPLGDVSSVSTRFEFLGTVVDHKHYFAWHVFVDKSWA